MRTSSNNCREEGQDSGFGMDMDQGVEAAATRTEEHHFARDSARVVRLSRARQTAKELRSFEGMRV